MKAIFTILLLISTISAFAQIPKEYDQELKREKKESRGLEKDFDVVLSPIEQVPVIPQGYSIQAGGNWGYAALEVDKYAEIIRQKAQRKVAVFVFDTGGKWDHPALNLVQWNAEGKTFTGEADPADGNGHSTHVAGIIGAVADTYDIGIGQELVKLGLLKVIPYKVLNNDGAGQFTWINSAIKAANARAIQLIDSGWGVVYNFSLGADGVNQPETNELLRQAEESGVFVCAAAGNTGKEGIGSPANGGSAHAVAALDRTITRAYYSTYGKEMYIAAPGSGIMSTYPPDGYRELSGTSMATPTQSALVALIMSCYPEATNKQISNYLQSFATDIDAPGWDKNTGWGVGLMGKILSGDPGKSPDDGNGNPGGDPGQQPEKDKHSVNIILPGTFTVRWKPLTDTGPFRATFISMKVQSTTRLYSEAEVDRVTELTKQFFSKYVFLLRNQDDLNDSVYWAGYFYEMLLNKEGNNLNIICINGHDDKGREVYVDKFGKLAGSLKLTFNPEIRPFEFRP